MPSEGCPPHRTQDCFCNEKHQIGLAKREPSTQETGRHKSRPEGDRLANLRANLGDLHRNRANPCLDSTFRLMTVLNNACQPIRCLVILECLQECFQLSLDCRLQKLPRTLAQQFGQGVCNDISTGQFNSVTLIQGGRPLRLVNSRYNDDPTRCTTNFQITQTPDTTIALKERGPG